MTGISARAITDGRNITSASRSVFPSVFFILVFSGLYGFMYFLLSGLSGFSFSLFMISRSGQVNVLGGQKPFLFCDEAKHFCPMQFWLLPIWR